MAPPQPRQVALTQMSDVIKVSQGRDAEDMTGSLTQPGEGRRSVLAVN